MAKKDKTVEEYKRYRRASRALNRRIVEHYMDKSAVNMAARILKMSEGKDVLVYDSDDELDVLMEFIQYETHQADGKTPNERYAEEQRDLDPIQRQLLDAMLKAETGLYQVRRALPDAAQISLANLLSPELPLVLTDMNLSRSAAKGVILFCRPLRMPNLAMTTGVIFAFPAEMGPSLVRRWENLEWKGSAERYGWFFQQSKRRGIETEFTELP